MENYIVIQRVDFYKNVILETFYAHRTITYLSCMIIGLGYEPQHKLTMENGCRNLDCEFP